MASQCVVKIYKTKAKTKKHTLKSKDRWKRENVTANINKLFRCIDSICRLSTKQLFHSLCSLCWLWCVYARAKLLDLFFVVFFFWKKIDVFVYVSHLSQIQLRPNKPTAVRYKKVFNCGNYYNVRANVVHFFHDFIK